MSEHENTGGLSDLIKALEIFKKYGDPAYPTHCEHDELGVCINPSMVSDEDKEELDGLGFFVDSHGEYFKSFRFGSA